MTTPSNAPVYELIGAALPQALRLARFQASKGLYWRTDAQPELASENDVISRKVSREEERILSANASVVAALEDIFSWRHKDRVSRVSKLSYVESVRFRRTIYRIWLLSSLHGADSPSLQLQRYVRDDDRDYEELWMRQKGFLQEFTSQDLVQINKAAIFLMGIADWAVMAECSTTLGAIDVYDWKGMYLFAGPHIILRCYEEATTHHLPGMYLSDEGLYENFLQRPLSDILKERNVGTPSGYVGSILDGINGENDRCAECKQNGNPFAAKTVRIIPHLYNETNWDYLKGCFEHRYLIPGKLMSNKIEQASFRAAMNGDWAELLAQMFACRREPFTKWSKQDWICPSCWQKFFWDTILLWRLDQKKQAGERIAEDCEHGYDCDLQSFERGLVHATRFNHLCVPLALRQLET